MALFAVLQLASNAEGEKTRTEEGGETFRPGLGDDSTLINGEKAWITGALGEKDSSKLTHTTWQGKALKNPQAKGATKCNNASTTLQTCAQESDEWERVISNLCSGGRPKTPAEAELLTARDAVAELKEQLRDSQGDLHRL